MFPKPKYKKQKKALNNKFVPEPRECALCGEIKVCETHEVYGGSNRQNSIRLKLQVPLCHQCHEDVTNNLPDTLEWQAHWKKMFQMSTMYRWTLAGMTEAEALDEWLKIIGRSYL